MSLGNAPQHLVDLHARLVTDLGGGNDDDLIVLSPPDPWKRGWTVDIALECEYEDDGDPENGPHLSMSVAKYLEIAEDQQVLVYNHKYKYAGCDCEKGCPCDCTGTCENPYEPVEADAFFRLFQFRASPEHFSERLKKLLITLEVNFLGAPIPGEPRGTCSGQCCQADASCGS